MDNYIKKNSQPKIDILRCDNFNAIRTHLRFKGDTHFYHASDVTPYFKKK